MPSQKGSTLKKTESVWKLGMVKAWGQDTDRSSPKLATTSGLIPLLNISENESGPKIFRDAFTQLHSRVRWTRLPLVFGTRSSTPAQIHSKSKNN